MLESYHLPEVLGAEIFAVNSLQSAIELPEFAEVHHESLHSFYH